MMSTFDIFVLLLFLAGVSVLQYFKGRRQNLILMKYTAEIFEKVFQPCDKEYQLIHLYVGYRAWFKPRANYVTKVEVTVTLLPRLSLLYYPFSLLTTRFDRVYLLFHYRKTPPHEVHIVHARCYRGGLPRELRSRNVSKVKVHDQVYYVVQEGSPELTTQLLNMLGKLPRPDIVQHLALLPRNNTMYVFMKLDVEYFEETLSALWSIAEHLLPRYVHTLA